MARVVGLTASTASSILPPLIKGAALLHFVERRVAGGNRQFSGILRHPAYQVYGSSVGPTIDADNDFARAGVHVHRIADETEFRADLPNVE